MKKRQAARLAHKETLSVNIRNAPDIRHSGTGCEQNRTPRAINLHRNRRAADKLLRIGAPQLNLRVNRRRAERSKFLRSKRIRNRKRRRRPYHDPGKTFQNMEMGKRCCTEHADSRPYSPFNLFRQRRKLRFGREKRQDALTRRIRRRAQLLRNGIEISLRNRSGKNKCGCVHTLRNGCDRVVRANQSLRLRPGTGTDGLHRNLAHKPFQNRAFQRFEMIAADEIRAVDSRLNLPRCERGSGQNAEQIRKFLRRERTVRRGFRLHGKREGC